MLLLFDSMEEEMEGLRDQLASSMLAMVVEKNFIPNLPNSMKAPEILRWKGQQEVYFKEGLYEGDAGAFHPEDEIV